MTLTSFSASFENEILSTRVWLVMSHDIPAKRKTHPAHMYLKSCSSAGSRTMSAAALSIALKQHLGGIRDTSRQTCRPQTHTRARTSESANLPAFNDEHIGYRCSCSRAFLRQTSLSARQQRMCGYFGSGSNQVQRLC